MQKLNYGWNDLHEQISQPLPSRLRLIYVVDLLLWE